MMIKLVLLEILILVIVMPVIIIHGITQSGPWHYPETMKVTDPSLTQNH